MTLTCAVGHGVLSGDAPVRETNLFSVAEGGVVWGELDVGPVVAKVMKPRQSSGRMGAAEVEALGI